MTQAKRTSWDWEIEALLNCERAASWLGAGDPDMAAKWSRLALIAGEAARLARWNEEKHSPEG